MTDQTTAPTAMTWTEHVATLAESQELRSAAYELFRLWRQGWDTPGSSGYTSYIMAHRALSDMLPNYRGSLALLAKDVWAASLSRTRD
jgi:hypothetical protein